jgi:hypothetical protein
MLKHHQDPQLLADPLALNVGAEDAGALAHEPAREAFLAVAAGRRSKRDQDRVAARTLVLDVIDAGAALQGHADDVLGVAVFIIEEEKKKNKEEE